VRGVVQKGQGAQQAAAPSRHQGMLLAMVVTAAGGRASESLKPGSIERLPLRYSHGDLAAPKVTLAGVKGLACDPKQWEEPAVHPRPLAVDTNAQICAHPTPQATYRRCPLSAHVSRIAVNSIPRYCCAVLGLPLVAIVVCHHTLSVSATCLSPFRPHVPSALGVSPGRTLTLHPEALAG
jgi:hypothetical protein